MAAYDSTAHGDSLKAQLAEPVAALRAWDYRWAAGSVPTSLAVYWGDVLMGLARGHASADGLAVYNYMATGTTAEQKLAALAAASGRLGARLRHVADAVGRDQPIPAAQRATSCNRSMTPKPSIPVPFTSARWGSLASFGARTYPGTKRMYGTSGNSFVAVVEFGGQRAGAGGDRGRRERPSGVAALKDQAERYAAGNLREVYFYPGQLAGHTERVYHPGAGGPSAPPSSP